ncbi:MAG: flagellar basal body P-ring protein FlgI [Hyphomonadaceae bacterium]|nr:flagellar basal body P-ring protein FlgI [Hyphomonadaceae bacterium]
MNLALTEAPPSAAMRMMNRAALLAAAAIASITPPFAVLPAEAAPRIKDIADFEGVRENQLVGYGLVVGLAGTGDSLRNSPFTRQSLAAMLERLGVNATNGNLNTRNVAAVMVTANLPPFASQGSRIDVTVSALGDARSLAGGQLLVTPLIGADQQVYAVAQGALAVGGFAAEGASGSSVSRGVTTAGRIASGALVEREISFDIAGQQELRLALRNPDFTTAQRIVDAINTSVGGPAARAANPGTIVLRRPDSYAGDMVTLLGAIENLEVQVDNPARIVIDENSGIVVMGDNVRVSTVAIAQGNLTISIQEDPFVSQPAPFSRGETVVAPSSAVQVEEEQGGLVVVPGGVPLRQLVNGLNALGVTPRDMISILQALKAAGAIQAEIEVM